MSISLNNVDCILDVFHKMDVETRPMLKMSVISNSMVDKTINEDLELLLSIYTHKILDCPKPKWKNASTSSDGQCLAVLKRILTDGHIDTKEFHELPIKVQAVLYNCSKANNIGLNISHITSCVNIQTLQDIYNKLEVNTKVNTSYSNCSRCGDELEDAPICQQCYYDIELATEYRSASFEVYGTSVKDFSINIRDFRVDVTNGLFKFTKLNESIERYEPYLPFDEYTKTLQLI